MISNTGSADLEGSAASTATRSLGVEDKVAFLSEPRSYPHEAHEFDIRETHISWVFLVGAYVYKLKKPVRYPHLDFSSLSNRKRFVSEEIRLNRRLAPAVYLGATPLSVDRNRELVLGEGEEVVDWLVTMRRLPEDRMMDRQISAGALTVPMLDELSDVLAGFFRAARPVSVSVDDCIERYLREHRKNAEILLDPSFGFDGSDIEAVLGRFERSIQTVRPLLLKRMRAGRFIEGHGDLRPEHVCFTEPLAIIDCLEFDRDLRLLDPFEEISLLGLECAQLGANWVYPKLFQSLTDRMGDSPGPALAQFYWTYRALLRARLSLFHLAEPDPRTPDRWRSLARRYAELAEHPPVIPTD